MQCSAKFVGLTRKLQDSIPLRKFEFGHLALSTAAGGDHLQMCKVILHCLRAEVQYLHAENCMRNCDSTEQSRSTCELGLETVLEGWVPVEVQLRKISCAFLVVLMSVRVVFRTF